MAVAGVLAHSGWFDAGEMVVALCPTLLWNSQQWQQPIELRPYLHGSGEAHRMAVAELWDALVRSLMATEVKSPV
jgi:hypothetical protein